MYALYGHPRYFKFKRKYQQYGLCFQTIFPFLMTMIHNCKKTTICIGLRQSRCSLYIFNVYVFFTVLPETPASYGKEILKYFLLYCSSIRMSSKGVSQILKIFFQTGNLNIFVHRSVCLFKYVQLKRTLSDGKEISGEI